MHNELGFRAGDVDLRLLQKHQLEHVSECAVSLGGASGLCSHVKTRLVLHKTYYRISEELSRDMEVCSFDLPPTEAMFPSESGYVRFEDPTLPAVGFLLGITRNRDPGIAVICDAKAAWQTADQVIHCYSFPFSDWNRVIVGDYELVQPKGLVPELDQQLSPEDKAAMEYMIRILLRVFCFASTDRSRVESIKAETREERKQIGIHPKHDLKGHAVSIRYLPSVGSERFDQKTEAIEESRRQNHVFKGRRGFVRTYRNVRFTQMLGKTQYIWPIPAPEGYSVNYIVRKPAGIT